MRRGVPIPIAAPMLGAIPDIDPTKIPADGARQVTNLISTGGYTRSRYGSTLFLDDSNAERVVDLFNLTWPDDTFEALRCVRNAIYRVNTTPAWASIGHGGGGTWDGTATDRFWAVVAPWSASSTGRIIIGNGVNRLRVWAGGAGTTHSH